MQHINLYDSSLRKPEEKFTANAVAAVIGLMFVGLLGISMVSSIRLSATNNEVAMAQANLHELQAQLKMLKEKLPKVSIDKSLPAVLKSKQYEAEQKQAVISILSERSLGNTEGFVQHLSGFARQHIPGLWLTNLKIEQGGTQLSLTGHALKPEHVPQYLQNLSNEPVLQGTEFKSFLLSNENKKIRRVDFTITTQPTILRSSDS